MTASSAHRKGASILKGKPEEVLNWDVQEGVEILLIDTIRKEEAHQTRRNYVIRDLAWKLEGNLNLSLR